MKEETQHRTIKQLWDELQEYDSVALDDTATKEDREYARKSLNATRIELLPRIHKDCDIMFCRGGSMVFHQGCNIVLTPDQAEEYAAAFQVAAWEVSRNAIDAQKGGGE